MAAVGSRGHKIHHVSGWLNTTLQPLVSSPGHVLCSGWKAGSGFSGLSSHTSRAQITVGGQRGPTELPPSQNTFTTGLQYQSLIPGLLVGQGPSTQGSNLQCKPAVCLQPEPLCSQHRGTPILELCGVSALPALQELHQSSPKPTARDAGCERNRPS